MESGAIASTPVGGFQTVDASGAGALEYGAQAVTTRQNGTRNLVVFISHLADRRYFAATRPLTDPRCTSYLVHYRTNTPIR
jgi:hypothetical protein